MFQPIAVLSIERFFSIVLITVILAYYSVLNLYDLWKQLEDSSEDSLPKKKRTTELENRLFSEALAGGGADARINIWIMNSDAMCSLLQIQENRYARCVEILHYKCRRLGKLLGVNPRWIRKINIAVGAHSSLQVVNSTKKKKRNSRKFSFK